MMLPSKAVLVLEDERPLVEAIRSKFETGGFTVVTARAVDQALDYLHEGIRVDAIWLDHYLFGKRDGLDFVTELREDKVLRKLPIFVVSNTVTPDKVATYLSLGVQRCYTKVDHRLDQIIADIEHFLNHHRP